MGQVRLRLRIYMVKENQQGKSRNAELVFPIPLFKNQFWLKWSGLGLLRLKTSV